MKFRVFNKAFEINLSNQEVALSEPTEQVKNHTDNDLLGVHANEKFINRIMDLVPNPDHILQKKGLSLNQAYDPLLYDAHVSSCIQSRKAGILSMEYDIDRGKKDTEETLFIKKVFYGDHVLKIDGFDIPKQIDEMLEASGYGFKPMEVYYRYVGDYLIATDIVGKPQDWFSFDSMGLLKFKGEYGIGMAETMLKKKFLVVRQNATATNPYGLGYLSKCFWPITFKKGGFRFWTMFTENNGSPYLLGKLGYSATADDIAKLMVVLNSLRGGGKAVVDVDAEIQSIQTGSPGTADIYKGLIHFLNAEISKAILSQTLTTEQGDTGSYSMSQTHLQVRADVVDMDKRMIESSYNKLIKWLIDFNFENPQYYPKFELYPKEDINQMLERDIKIAATGQVKLTKQRWSKYLDEGDFEVFDKPQYPNTQFQLYSPGNTFEFAENETVEELAEKQLNKAVENMINPLLESLETGKSYSDIENELKGFFPKLKTDDIQGIIGSLNFVKAVEGFEGAK